MRACEAVQTRLQQDYRLRVLRIYMDNTSTEKPLAVFTLILGDGTEAALLTASMPELGFPEAGAVRASHNPPLPDSYRLPVHVSEALAAWLREDGAGAAPLWLRLSVPLGLLAAVPWEELLQPRLGIPVLRLPYQALTPRIPAAGIDTLLCISSPEDEPGLPERLERFVQEVPFDLARSTRFHLFGNRVLHPHLLALRDRYSASVSMQVYDPARALVRERPGNPWLTWMEAEMGEGGADVIHFLCHGTHEFDEGALVLAADPGEPQGLPGCVLARPDLVDFLDQLGAWCVAFTSAPAERSAAGMRLLQTAVAQYRPGPVLVHDMNVPGSREGLQAAYRFLFSPSTAPPATPAVALYCHPVLLSAHADDPVSNEQLARFTLDSRLGGKVHDRAQPWLASSQRKLELTAASLASAVEEGAVGRARARELVLDALASQARQTAGPGEEEQ